MRSISSASRLSDGAQRVVSPLSPLKLKGAAEPGFEDPFELVVVDIPLTATLVRKVVGQFGSGETEREVGGPTRVSVPIAPFARPIYWRSLTNGLGNGIPAITGDSHAHRDLGVQAREVSILWKRLASNLGGEVQPIGLSQRRDRDRQLRPNALGAKPLPIRGDRRLAILNPCSIANSTHSRRNCSFPWTVKAPHFWALS